MDQCKEHLSGYLLFQSIQNLFFNQVEEDRKIIAPISATFEAQVKQTSQFGKSEETGVR